MDLQTATTEELIDELKSRFDLLIVTGMRDTKTGDMSEAIFTIKGSGFGALGMLRTHTNLVEGGILADLTRPHDEDEE